MPHFRGGHWGEERRRGGCGRRAGRAPDPHVARPRSWGWGRSAPVTRLLLQNLDSRAGGGGRGELPHCQWVRLSCQGQGEVKVKVALAPSQAATFFLSPGPWRDLERTPRVLSTETRLFPNPTHGQVHLGSPGATEPPARSRRVGRRGQDGRGPIPCRPLSAVPDSIIMNVLSSRLTQHDCIQKGWVMYGFPRDLDQAHMLDTLEYKPNR